MSCIKVYFNNITNIWGLQWPKKATKQRAIAKDITLIIHSTNEEAGGFFVNA